MIIENSVVSKHSPTFIVAEIGANHNGDIKLAKETIQAAAECGVNAVKFQTYSAEELLADPRRLITYGKPGEETEEEVGKMFNRLALPRDDHKELFEYANKLGLIAFSTPFSEGGVHFLEELDAPCYKVAASDVSYLDMLAEIAKTKKPVFLSLGKSTIGEADRAITVLEENGSEDIVVMHCIAQYPSPMNEMNLNVINTLQTMYPEHTIGFSDHSLGITAALGAVVLGARVIEKHFTLDKELEGPDHWFSMNPTEMKALVTEIRNMEMALGESRKRIFPSEKEERKTSIRSIVLKNKVNAGEKIKESDLKITRPGWGISPHDKDKVIGMCPAVNLDENTVLVWDYFK